MNHITLYRIKSAPFPKNYRVSQAYRILTEQPLSVPEGFALHGVHFPEAHSKWFEDNVIPLIEHHNGDSIIDKWAVPLIEDPEHITIAITINNTLISPDILSNTTYWGDGPDMHKQTVDKIFRAICEVEHCEITLPRVDTEWLKEKAHKENTENLCNAALE